jgi:hypothetical protein
MKPQPVTKCRIEEILQIIRSGKYPTTNYLNELVTYIEELESALEFYAEVVGGVEKTPVITIRKKHEVNN